MPERYFETFGDGEPTTLFAHGFGGSIRDTRPFGTGVHGSKTFMHFRGHGGRPAPHEPWTYAGLAGELRETADAVGATRALGVSMGAGALARVLSETPDRFDKAAFVLPAALDARRGAEERALSAERMRHVAALAANGDVAAVRAELAAREPAPVRDLPAAQAWLTHRAELLVTTDAKYGLNLPGEVAVDDIESLAAVDVPTLVLTHEGDEAHPVSVAEAYAAALPQAKLIVLPAGSILWLGRSEVRSAIQGFFNDG
ncbi:alpha/beta fold hydrolase [Spelaeicoccus albus]|uniref:Pimeloyl-ACP methyl ester carboxylesterase n=1 Tax=Spelaeicoccus albus TaxID=1280376 RepID=A0A7Z0A9D7_9MICO|nr:alpha/beta hydrolase [Spelaeicoccus albus]NYI66016.1 pimeloyl-ACP methyl ester carboxylesterase [Spelaeicoccus albus]